MKVWLQAHWGGSLVLGGEAGGPRQSTGMAGSRDLGSLSSYLLRRI